MGFQLEQATVALSAAFGDVSRAAEYLFNPASMPQMSAPAPAAPAGAAAPGAPAKAPATDDPLAELRKHKQLAQIKAVIQKDPTKIKAVLDQIGKTKPDLLKKINENMESFIELMNEPEGTVAQPAALAAPAAAGSGGAPPTAGGGADAPAGMQEMQAGLMQALQQMDMPPAARAQLQQMMASMTPEQMQQVMMQMMGGMGGLPGMPGMPAAGGPGGAPGVPPGATQIQLTQAEAEDVNFVRCVVARRVALRSPASSVGLAVVVVCCCCLLRLFAPSLTPPPSIRVPHLPLPSSFRTLGRHAGPHSSQSWWGATSSARWRHTCRATRTRRWQPTCCSAGSECGARARARSASGNNE